MIRDIAVFVIFGFILAVVLIIGNLAIGLINDAVQAGGEFTAQGKTVMQEQTDKYDTVWDYTFLMIMIAIALGAIIISYQLSSNPAVFWVMILIVVIFGGVAGFLANAYDDLTAETTFAASAAGFPIMDYVMTHSIQFTIGIVILMIIAFYAKPEAAYG